MYIEYVTHASLLIKSAANSILLDPFYFIDPEFSGVIFNFPYREISKSTFGTLNYLYSSHIHPDHSHPETLNFLKDKTKTVLLPANNPDLEKRFIDLGFQSIILLENQQPFKLNENFEVTGYWDDNIDSALIIKIDNKVIFHQNDCKLTPNTLEKIAADYSIDYAFMLYTDAQDLYPLLLPRSDVELNHLVAEREKVFLNNQINCIDILNPSVVIPYSYTITYFQPDQIHLNGYSRLTPKTFSKLLAAYRPQNKCLIMQPGDVLDTQFNSINYYRRENLWGETVTEFIQNINYFYKNNKTLLPKFNWGDPEKLDKKFQAYIKQRLHTPFLPILEKRILGIYVKSENKLFSYLIDINNRRLLVWKPNENHPQKLGAIDILMPASILEQLLIKKYDPLSIIYSYKIKFKININSNLSPQAEVMLYVFVIISFFFPELIESNAYKARYSILGQWK